jgi:hypothetical protein
MLNISLRLITSQLNCPDFLVANVHTHRDRDEKERERERERDIYYFLYSTKSHMLFWHD